MKYILLSLFTILHSIPIFIFNAENTQINGNLSVLKNLYHNDTINFSSSCNLNCNTINFDGIFTVQSFGNIILNNIPECNLSDNIYLLGLDENKLIIKDSNKAQKKTTSIEKTMSNINGLNDNSLTFQSSGNSIFIAPSITSSVIINCQNLSLNNVFGKEIIFNNAINDYNIVLLGDFACNTFQVNNGSIFIKTPTTIAANSSAIDTIESKNNNTVNVIQGNITVNNSINQITGIIVSPIDTPSSTIICVDNNNQIKTTETIMNFWLNINTLSHPNAISIDNIKNITGNKVVNFNTTTITVRGINSNLNFTGMPFNEIQIDSTLSTSNQEYLGKTIFIENSCIINSLNLPITFLIDCNSAGSFLDTTIFSQNTYFLNLQGTSTYSHYLCAKNSPIEIFKMLPSFSLKNNNNDITKKILHKLYEITKEIKNNVKNIKNVIETEKKESKKNKKYITENKILSEKLTLLLDHYCRIKQITSDKHNKEIEKILLQLSELESAL